MIYRVFNIDLNWCGTKAVKKVVAVSENGSNYRQQDMMIKQVKNVKLTESIRIFVIHVS